MIFSLSWFFESQATTTFLFIRHGDIGIATGGENPPLSQEGYNHSLNLIEYIKDIDVITTLNQIYVDDTTRSYETALPLSQTLNVPIEKSAFNNVQSFIAQTLRKHKGEIILVIGDSNIIPSLVEELHGSKNLPRNNNLTHDQLYIVTVPWFGKVKTLRINI
jgi:broad specificity phosphatase PhoE